MSTQKKILFVANVAKEHINKFHIPTIKEFRKNGWIVDVACSNDAAVPECDHQWDMCWKRSPFTFKTIKGIRQLKKLLKKENYDVVYCHTPVGGLVGRIAARGFRKNGTKVVYCAHGLHFFKGAPLKNWIIFYPMEKFLAKFTDCFITINEEDYNRVKHKFNKKMRVELIPGIGVNFERLKVENPEEARENYRRELNIPNDSTILIYVAELLPNKNQKMLVDVLEKLRETEEDVYLVLPGPDHEEGALSNYIRDKDLVDRVRILGWRNDVGELLYTSDIYVASSIREGFGINLVEAMYCGLPVVATNNRGHQMVVKDGENGFLVDLNDVDTMTLKVRDLINYAYLREHFTKIDIKQYDCNFIANKLYERINNYL